MELRKPFGRVALGFKGLRASVDVSSDLTELDVSWPQLGYLFGVLRTLLVTYVQRPPSN